VDSLNNEILKYKKKGFEVVKKHGKPLKHGSRTVLIKKVEGLVFDTEEAVYIYFVNGDATTDSYREFFKDYERFFENHNFDEDDRGIFLCSGRCDKRLFKDLKKGVEDDDVYNSIKLITLNERAEKEVEKKHLRTEEETREVKEQPRTEKKEAIDETKKATISTDNTELESREVQADNQFKELIDLIRNFQVGKPLYGKRREKKLQHQFSGFLMNSKYRNEFRSEVPIGENVIDFTIRRIGIELKYSPNPQEFERLFSQVERFARSGMLDYVVVVVCAEEDRARTIAFRERVRPYDWGKKVFVETVS
jgi:hypothetical protein